MANRKNTFLLKRSNVAGNIPAAGQILLGELALNTADVILYASGTTINSIIPIGWDRVARTGDTMTGTLYAPSISATTITAINYLGLPTDIRVTGGTYSSGTATFTNNTGGTFNVTGFSTGGGTDFTGGTVTGATNFTGGLTANTISATTLTATTIYGNGANITGITGSFGITVDGSGSVLTTGVKGFLVMPYNATITGWDIIGNTTGNCVFDIWKSSGLTIPTVINTITGSEKPTLNSQQVNSDNTLSSWSTDVFINDIIAFNVDSASTLSRVNLIIKVIKK